MFLSCVGVLIVLLLGKRCRRFASMGGSFSQQCKTSTTFAPDTLPDPERAGGDAFKRIAMATTADSSRLDAP
jgi:hypothetical protein